MTFFELIESFQKQKSFRQRVSPQYDSSYLLATHHCVIPDDQLRNLQTGHESRVQPPPITIDINFPSLPLPAVEKGTTRGRKRAQRSVAQSAPSTPTKSGSHKSTPSSLLSMSCFQDHLTESCIDELKKWFSRRSHGDATVSGQQMKNWQSPQRNKRAQESQEAQEIVDISVQDPVKHKRRRKEGTSIKPVKDDAVHVDVEEIDESPKQHQLPDDKEKQNKKIATTKRSTRSTKKVILMNVSDDEPTSSHKEEQVINPKEQSGDRLEILAKNNLSSSAQFALRFYLEI